MRSINDDNTSSCLYFDLLIQFSSQESLTLFRLSNVTSVCRTIYSLFVYDFFIEKSKSWIWLEKKTIKLIRSPKSIKSLFIHDYFLIVSLLNSQKKTYYRCCHKFPTSINSTRIITFYVHICCLCCW